MKSIDVFIGSWSGNKAMSPVSTADVAELELTMKCVFPSAYKYLLTTYGLIRTPNVMSKTVDLDTKISHVHDFLNLDDVSCLSKLYEMNGMDEGHILFASDAGGNMFCFKLTDCLAEKEDSAVWFFNREDFTIKKVSDSFLQWLEAFNLNE